MEALTVSEKDTGRKEAEKGGGCQGTCFDCGNVSHKAAECMVNMVWEMGLESEKPIGEEPSWVVAGAAEVSMPKTGERKNADDAGSLDAEER